MSHNPLDLGRPLDPNVSSSPPETHHDSHLDHASIPSSDAHPPRLEHARTAPTTVPIMAVAQQPTTGTIPEKDNGSDASPTPTLNHPDVPPNVGGLHGQPLPGSHANIDEKDHQAMGQGNHTGSHIATLARKELHLDTGVQEDDHFDEKQIKGPPSPSTAKRLERTHSGTHIPRNHKVTGESATGIGMVPITRKISSPPGVGIFGGVAPSGPDAEEGLRPVRSHEEEQERELARMAKGPDPWSVKFEPGEAANPKVRRSHTVL